MERVFSLRGSALAVQQALLDGLLDAMHSVHDTLQRRGPPPHRLQLRCCSPVHHPNAVLCSLMMPDQACGTDSHAAA